MPRCVDALHILLWRAFLPSRRHGRQGRPFELKGFERRPASGSVRDGIAGRAGEETEMEHRRPALWGIVLAGGEGARLREFVHEFLGTDVPKQFCAFTGHRTMVEHTLRRAELLISPARVMVAATASLQPYVCSCLGDRPAGTVLLQPAGRETTAGILLPLVHILHRDPEALVAVFPSDHFVMPGQRFMDIVQDATEFLIGGETESVLLLGAAPTDAEAEYGWLKPGASAGWAGQAVVRHVRGFIEKPSREQAEAFLAGRWLWNTMVTVSRGAVLMGLIRQAAPEVAAFFDAFRPYIGTRLEASVLGEVYHMLPSLNFSTAILQRCPEQLRVLPVRNVMWSDWGKRERVLATLAGLGVPWPVQAGAGVEGRRSPIRGAVTTQ